MTKMFSRGRYSAAFVENTVKRGVRHSPKSKAVVAAEAVCDEFRRFSSSSCFMTAAAATASLFLCAVCLDK
jgi:hypothetical protein